MKMRNILSALCVAFALIFGVGNARAQTGPCGYSSSALVGLINETIKVGVVGGITAPTVNNDLVQMIDCIMNIDSYNPAALTSLGITPNTSGGFATWPISISGSSSIVYFDTLSTFTSSATLPGGITYVYVRAVTGTYPPAAGTDATPLWFKPVGTATGIWGEVTVAGQIFDPIYSTNPVQVGEFGIVPDGHYSYGDGAEFTMTSTGTTTVSVSAMVGSGCLVGYRVSSLNWATRTANSQPVIPTGTVVVSTGTGTLTLSNSIPTMTNVETSCWADDAGGTDNSAAEQAAFNFALQYNYANVHFPDGIFYSDAGLNAGWGEAYHQLVITGGKRSPYADLSGTVLLFGVFNVPAISAQSLLNSSLHGVSIIGRNYNFNKFSQGWTTWSTNPYDYVAPEFSPSGAPGGFTQHAPMAGVTLDAYCGSAPSIPYPNWSPPSWTGLSPGSPYGRGSYSTNFDISEAEIDGFAFGYVNGLQCPLNGDFSKLTNLSFQGDAYPLAIVQPESRNVDVRNVNSIGHFAILTNSAIGLASGELSGPIVNVNSSQGYEMFDFEAMAFAGPVVIENPYEEATVRFGTFTGTNGTGVPVRVTGGNLNLTGAGSGQLPASWVTNDGPVTFVSTIVNGGPRISNWSFGGGGLYFEGGGTWACATTLPNDSNFSLASAQQAAVNYSGGCLLGTARFNSSGNNLSNIATPVVATYYPTPSTTSAGLLMGRFPANNGASMPRAPMTQSAVEYLDAGRQHWLMTVPPEFPIDTSYNQAVSVAPSLSNDLMSFGYCSAFQAPTESPISTGNILYNTATGTNFVVVTVGSPVASGVCTSPATYVTIIAQQQNNIIITPGTNTFVSNMISASQITGYLININGPHIKIPSELYYGNTTSGSPSVTAIANATSLSIYFQIGDIFSDAGSNTGYGSNWLYGPSVTAWPTPVGGDVVSGVSPGNPGSLTMSSNAQSTCAGCPIFPFMLK